MNDDKEDINININININKIKMKKINVQFEGHRGFIYLDENDRIEFYRMSFATVQEAIKFVKNLKLPAKDEEYHRWFYREKKGLLSTTDRQIFIDGHWLPNEDFAEEYIKTSEK
jgi:hypothetical protein